jgi:hypothetical protein
MLTREPIYPSIPDLVDNESLYRDAAAYLDYDPARVIINEPVDREDLQVAMSVLGIRPFTTASVKEHKAARALPGDHKWKGGVLVFLGLLIAAAGFYSETMEVGTTVSHWLLFFLATALIGVGILVAIVRMSWKMTPLRDYRQPVPEFALQTAIDLAKKCPTAQFFIDEIETDPFLVVKTRSGRTVYYLESWNEPGFKKEREA